MGWLFTDALPESNGADYTFSDHMEPLKNTETTSLLYSKMRFGGNHHNDHRCFVGNTNTNPDSLDQIVAEHAGHQSRVRNVVTFIGHATTIVASWRDRLPVMPIQSTRVLLKPFSPELTKRHKERLLANKRAFLMVHWKKQNLDGTCLGSR